MFASIETASHCFGCHPNERVAWTLSRRDNHRYHWPQTRYKLLQSIFLMKQILTTVVPIRVATCLATGTDNVGWSFTIGPDLAISCTCWAKVASNLGHGAIESVAEKLRNVDGRPIGERCWDGSAQLVTRQVHDFHISPFPISRRQGTVQLVMGDSKQESLADFPSVGYGLHQSSSAWSCAKWYLVVFQ
jgi:hypothetical protein